MINNIAILGCGLMAKAFVRGLRNYGFDKFDSIRFIDKDTHKVRELFDFAIMLGATEERLVYGDPIDLANDSAYDRLKKTLTDVDLLFNFSTYRYALNVLNASIEAKCHYVDLGGNPEVVQQQIQICESMKSIESMNGVIAVVNAGLAPGLAEQHVNYLARQGYKDINVLCGGNPVNPNEYGALKYGSLFSTEGLLNEYSGKAEIITNGQIKEFDSLISTRLDDDVRDMVDGYEYFLTSGVFANSMWGFSNNGVMNLSYQTLRYKGHLDKIKSLKEFGLLNQCAIRDLSKHINIPVCKKDITLFVVVAKKKDLTYSYSLEVYGDDEISGLAVATTAPIIELIDVIKNCESYNLTGVFLPYLIPDDPLNDESYFLPSLKYIDAGKYNITTREVKTDVN